VYTVEQGRRIYDNLTKYIVGHHDQPFAGGVRTAY